jgi:hypothetical protein
LEDDVAVGEHDCASALTTEGSDVEGAWVEPFGERIVEDERAHMQQRGRVVEAGAESLQCCKIVGDAGFLAQRRIERPVAVALRNAKRGREMFTKVGGEAVVVEQRVVDVEQPYRRRIVQHGGLFSATGLRQPSSPVNTPSASPGPHVPGS